jgi:hypothetical protein
MANGRIKMKINRKVELTFARGVNIYLHICSLSVGPVGIEPATHGFKVRNLPTEL